MKRSEYQKEWQAKRDAAIKKRNQEITTLIAQAINSAEQGDISVPVSNYQRTGLESIKYALQK